MIGLKLPLKAMVFCFMILFLDGASAKFFDASAKYDCIVTANSGLRFDKRLGSWQSSTFVKGNYKFRASTEKERSNRFSLITGDWVLEDLSEPSMIIPVGGCSVDISDLIGRHMSCKAVSPFADKVYVAANTARFYISRSGGVPSTSGGDDAIMETGYCSLIR